MKVVYGQKEGSPLGSVVGGEGGLSVGSARGRGVDDNTHDCRPRRFIVAASFMKVRFPFEHYVSEVSPFHSAGISGTTSMSSFSGSTRRTFLMFFSGSATNIRNTRTLEYQDIKLLVFPSPRYCEKETQDLEMC